MAITPPGGEILPGQRGNPVKPPPNTAILTAGEFISAGMVVAPSPDQDDTIVRADANAAIGEVGISVIDTPESIVAQIRYRGPVTLDTAQWDAIAGTTGGLTRNTWYYVSSGTPGHLVDAPPGSMTASVIPVGFALSPTTLFVNSARVTAGQGGLIASLLATPVKNARQWTTAIAPNGSDWNYITQCYNYPADEPSQWVVINLETGAYTFDVGPNEIYSNANWQIDTALQGNGPLIAPNGRIFFAMSSSPDLSKINIAYYDPGDKHVHQLQFTNPHAGNQTSIVFSGWFNHDGSKLFFGTQAGINEAAFTFELDPVTLAFVPLALVGAPSNVNPNYAYYVAKDEGPGADYLYVAVGQDPWQLVAVKISDGTTAILYTTTGPGQQAIQFDPSPTFGTVGWRTTIIDNAVATNYWLADGDITAYPGSGAPPGGARDVTPYAAVLASPPQVKYTLGAGFVAWRPNGSSSDYQVDTYPVTLVDPIPIETLTTLADGALFGNTVQYNGYWRCDPTNGDITWYGPGDLALLSQPANLIESNTVAYLCGYANGALYLYNPSLPWNPLDPGGNPTELGEFSTAGSFMKYCYFLRLSSNGKLYAAGRRERDGIGSGVGSYSIAGAAFAGVVTDPLPNYDPRGFLVLDDFQGGRLVFSGVTHDASDAHFLIFSDNLGLTSQPLVRTGVSDSGLIYRTATPGVIIGIASAAGAVYRYDLNTSTMLDWAPQTGTLGTQSSSVGPDGSIYYTLNSDLYKIDPATFVITKIGTFNVSIDPTSSFTTWRGTRMYLANDSVLYSVNLL